MATMRGQKINRSDLSKFLPTPQLIKQFEAITEDVVDNLPSAADEAQATADEALVIANTTAAQNFVLLAATPALPNARGLAVGTGLTLTDTGPGVLLTVRLQAFLQALSLLAGFGMVAKTASGAELRTIEAGSPRIEVLNGDGASGNPAIDIDEPSLDVGNMGGTLGIPHGGTGVTVLSAFSAHNNNVAHAIPSAVYTKLTWSTEEYDLNSNFAASSWTPPAGRPVSFCAGCVLICTAAADVNMAVYKNGAVFKQGSRTTLPAAGQAEVIVACMDVPNGTDVYDVRILQSSGVSQNTNAQSWLTYFQGSML